MKRAATLPLWLLFLAAPALAQPVPVAEEEETVPVEEPAPETPSEEEAREADMFGGDDDDDDDDDDDEGVQEPTTPRLGSRDEQILGSSTSSEDIFERLADADDTLEIGGLAFLRYNYSALDEGKAKEFPVDSPSLVDVYLDARPSDHVRFFTRARLNHDATRSEDESSVALDQLWFKFDIDLTAFFTIGRQRIKWGTGRFWNPSDFLNNETLDPLSVTIFDERLGVSLFKLHVPVESIGANLYAIASLDESNRAENIGGALRAELIVGESELSASFVARKKNPLRMAADYSGALGPFDLRVEAAVQHGVKTPFFRGRLDASPLRLDEFDLSGVMPEDLEQAFRDQLPAVLAGRQPERYFRDDEFLTQVMAGFEYGRNYTDDDAFYLGAEYFFNQQGYKNPNLYPVLFQEGQFTPFYTGRHYAALYAFLPAPGSWNNTNFTSSALANLSDRSLITRIDYSTNLLTYLTLNAFVMGNWGEAGEFNYSYEQAALLDPVLVQMIPPESLDEIPPELLEGVSIPGPLFSLGVGLRMAF
jgi:hypothetical protein